MTPERWEKIKALFSSAYERPVDGRYAFLEQACEGDDELRREVEELLRSHDENDAFLQNSAVAEAVSMIGEIDAARSDDHGSASSQFELGSVVNDRYKIVRLLGRGGMGEVYLALDARINRNVALKVLHSDLLTNKESLRRFALETEAVSALNHPHIVTIYELDSTDDGTRFFVTEYVEGRPLSSLIGTEVEFEKVLDIVIQTASALSAAHAAGIVHRDIKPDNIMIRSDGYIKVLDFGLAKLSYKGGYASDSASEDQTKALEETRPGVVMGTAAYMSPEQARGRQIDTRTDIWSLGVVLFELLTGHRPFGGDSPADIVVSVLSTEPKPISTYVDGLPAELEWVVKKSLSKDVEGRFQTIREFRSDLESIKKQIEYNRSAGQAADLGKTAAALEENVKPDVRPTAADAARPTAGGQDIAREDNRSERLLGVSGLVGRGKTHKVAVAVAAVILAAVVTSAVYFGVVQRSTGSIDSIAVLPFDNPGNDPELAYASEGISENMIDRLSQISQIKVISKNSSFRFRGSNIDIRDAAERLGARAIMTGSVSRSGDDILIRYDIVDVVNDRQLAGGQFRQKASDLSLIQNQIATKALEQFRLVLGDGQTKRVVGSTTENSDANRYYLSGLVEMNSEDNSRARALEYFEKAVALDPELAEAYVEIAWIYWSRANSSSDPAQVMPKASEAAKRALTIDPLLSKAHAVQAMVYEYEFNWTAAESEYRRAIELSPNLDFNRNNYAFFLSVMGRQEEALAQLEEQRLRDPINRRLALLQKAIVLVQARRFDDALETYREAQAIEPTNAIPDFALGYAYAGKANYRQAAEYFEKAVNEVGGKEKYSQSLMYLAVTYAKMPERRAEAKAIITRIESSEAFVSPALLAFVHSALGDKEKAVDLLEKAYIKKDVLLRYIGVAFEYDDLRTDPRFIDLLRRTGLSSASNLK